MKINLYRVGYRQFTGNHTIPEAYNSLQKVLKKEGKYKIKKTQSYTLGPLFLAESARKRR